MALSRSRSKNSAGEQCPAVVQTRQVVVLGEIPQLLLGLHPSLHLGEQRSDRFERIELVLGPGPVAVLDESEHPRGEVSGHQGRRGHRGGRYVAGLLDALLVVVCRRLGTENHGLFAVLGLCEHLVGVGEVHQGQRIGIGNVRPDRPLRDQTGRANLVVVVAQETDVDAEVVNQIGQYLLAHLDGGGRVGGHQPGCRRGDDTIEAA
jgi:hypothetical protein